MIKRNADMVREVRSRMRGGEGEVHVTNIFTQEELTGQCRFFALTVFPPGSSIGYHPHEGEEEIYYVLSGQGEVNDNGNVQVVGPGDAILTGGGASHSIVNTGTEPLEILAVILLFPKEE